ncbi:hypothetical protein scyTo_0026609 [Scyliorhinus torazame]|uniref:Uncharacterized protein n=1 Tax=Scyliorhinus torazame TaxID=75743 RepID=A0A401QL06_SCYTO|nr:hypothetical protein [Scyliorhinus torazame]
MRERERKLRRGTRVDAFDRGREQGDAMDACGRERERMRAAENERVEACGRKRASDGSHVAESGSEGTCGERESDRIDTCVRER